MGGVPAHDTAYRGGVHPRRPHARPGGVGHLLRDWREHRRRSQLDLALDVGVSARHLSFVETGRSRPSPELVLAIAERLDVPLRERNALLLAAGYAPRYEHTPLDDASMASVRGVLERLLQAHDPSPAVVVDRHWDVVLANAGAAALLEGVGEAATTPTLNTYRAALHPDGLAPRIDNPDEWVGHLLSVLERQVAATRDPALRALLDEVSGYPIVTALGGGWRTRSPAASIVVPLRLRAGDTVQTWFTTNTSFGTPVDITLDELHVELFHPA